MSISDFGFFFYLALLIISFALALAKYNGNKRDSNSSILTVLAYSIGNSLFLYGVFWLLGLVILYFSGHKIESFEVYSLLATTITSTGLSVSIYLEQKLDRSIEKVENIYDLSTEIIEKITNDVTTQLSSNVELITNEVIKQASDNISLKIRPKPLRKEIAKQVAKNEKENCYIKK